MDLGRLWNPAVFDAAAWAGVVLAVLLAAGLAACAPVPALPGTGGRPPASGMPVQPPAAATDLSITVTASPGAKPLDYRLVVENGRPGPETTVPDPAAAVAALEGYGQAIFFPVPGPPRMCSDVYSGPQVAVVRGVFKGRDVRSTFKRTDSCETARWQALAPLFGAVAGGTGAT